MNRIILIGNGFDLAHGLKTSYGDFIDWYWREWKEYFLEYKHVPQDDILCSIDNKTSNRTDISIIVDCFGNDIHKLKGYDFGKKLLSYDFDRNRLVIQPCALFKEIHKAVETKGWVDIENEYYNLLVGKNSYPVCNTKELNEQLMYLRKKLINYLNSINIEENMQKKHIKDIIYAPISHRDIAVSNADKLVEHIHRELTCTDNELQMKAGLYKLDYTDFIQLKGLRKNQDCSDDIIQTKIWANQYPKEFFLPNEIMFLNFNYTNTAKLYLPTPKPGFTINHIHGELSNPESVIFGYGDEMDENYKKLSDLNDNEYLKNFKSFKYSESDRYRKALQFMEAEPYQVYIMGHSCGNSDRTFLSHLFNHKNCVSIKPYYFIKEDGTDNYLDIVLNISRNFTDMKLMRDRVVNKTYCEAFSDKKRNPSVE